MTPAANKQTRLLIIMILFVGLVAGYIYYSRFAPTGSDEALQSVDNPKDTLIKFKDLKFDFQIFNSANIKSLKIFGEAPVRPDLTGKINPFANF